MIFSIASVCAIFCLGDSVFADGPKDMYCPVSGRVQLLKTMVDTQEISIKTLGDFKHIVESSIDYPVESQPGVDYVESILKHLSGNNPPQGKRKILVKEQAIGIAFDGDHFVESQQNDIAPTKIIKTPGVEVHVSDYPNHSQIDRIPAGTGRVFPLDSPVLFSRDRSWLGLDWGLSGESEAINYYSYKTNGFEQVVALSKKDGSRCIYGHCGTVSGKFNSCVIHYGLTGTATNIPGIVLPKFTVFILNKRSKKSEGDVYLVIILKVTEAVLDCPVDKGTFEHSAKVGDVVVFHEPDKKEKVRFKSKEAIGDVVNVPNKELLDKYGMPAGRRPILLSPSVVTPDIAASEPVVSCRPCGRRSTRRCCRSALRKFAANCQ